MVSVIVCVYKESPEWISRSIGSIISQSFKDIEIVVVVDNPSIDESSNKILNQLADSDHRVIILRNEKNIGAASSRNKGVAVSKGNYIAFLDADDYCYNSRIEIELQFLVENSVDIVCSRYTAVDENGLFLFDSPIVSKNINSLLPLYNPVANPTILLRRDVFLALNGFRNLVVCEDYDLWLRAISMGYKIGLVNESLIYYTVRQNSLSHQNMLKTYLNNKLIKKYHKQRLKTGRDSFSEVSISHYSSIKNYDNKEKRLSKAALYLDKAKEKKGLSLFYLVIAFCYYPIFIFERVLLKVRVHFIK